MSSGYRRVEKEKTGATASDFMSCCLALEMAETSSEYFTLGPGLPDAMLEAHMHMLCFIQKFYVISIKAPKELSDQKSDDLLSEKLSALGPEAFVP